MIEFADKIGHPWHGLARAGAIDLPNGQTMPLPGATPTQGDSFRIGVPGMPAPEQTAADTAAGRTWLPYAIMAGRNHVLYGKQLGEGAFIHIDSAGAAWRVNYNAAGGLLTLTLTPFGRFFGPADPVVVSVALTLPAGTVLLLEDIDSAGRQIAFSARQMINDIYGGWDWPIPKAIWLLTISGLGAAPELALVQHDWGLETNVTASNTGGPIYWLKHLPTLEVTGPFDLPPGYETPVEHHIARSTKSGVSAYHTERAVGATLHGDVFRLVKTISQRDETTVINHDLSSLFNAADPDLNYDGVNWAVRATAETVIGGYFAIEVDGNRTQFDIAHHVAGDQPFGPYSTLAPLTVAGETVSTDPGATFDGYTWPFVGDLRIHEVRVANRAYLVQAFSQIAPSHLYLGAASPSGSEVAPIWTNSAPHKSATAHPVTGQLVTSDAVNVCWV